MRLFLFLTSFLQMPSASVGNLSSQILDHARNETYWQTLGQKTGDHVCFVPPNDSGEDDAPAIMRALNHECRKNSIVIFPGPVYNIKSNMSTLDMDNVHIHNFGRFLWSTDIEYWLSVSMPVGFQNQSTVWYFGGTLEVTELFLMVMESAHLMATAKSGMTGPGIKEISHIAQL